MNIGISIVHYGEQKLLDDCLKSLNVKYYDDFDGCGGRKYRILDSIFEVKVYDSNINNIGFTAGNNVVIKHFLLERGITDWIWLLNNDTTVPKETLEAIEKVLPTLDKEIGIVGFKILSMDNPDLIHHAGTGNSFPFGEHKSGSVRLKQFNKRTNEKWVTFASVLIRREVFESIGLLDEKMVNYYSDSEFCFRARYNGWRVIYEPSFVIHHKIGQSQNPSEAQQKVMKLDGVAFQNKMLNGKVFFDLDKELV